MFPELAPTPELVIPNGDPIRRVPVAPKVKILGLAVSFINPVEDIVKSPSFWKKRGVAPELIETVPLIVPLAELAKTKLIRTAPDPN